MISNCRHNKPSFACVSCGYEQLLLGQRAGVVTRLPKDVNKMIYAMVQRPTGLLRFELDPESGLLRYQHVCYRDCWHQADATKIRTLNIAFYGAVESMRGFAYGLIFRFNAEDELWYHRDHVQQGQYDEYSDLDWEPTRHRVMTTFKGWTFTCESPGEFASGLATAFELSIPEIDPRADGLHDHAAIEYSIWEPNAPPFRCSYCLGPMRFEFEPCDCGSYPEPCDYTILIELRKKQYPCEVIYGLTASEVKFEREPVKIVDPICKAILKSGKRCTYKAKSLGLCGVHLNC